MKLSRPHLRLSMAAVAICLFPLALPATAQTKVGDTKDACDASHVVKFQAIDGTATVKAPGSKSKDLPGLTREITWYCGGTRERSANDEQFDHVKLLRAKNGAMQWTFFRNAKPAGPTGSEVPPDKDGTSGLTRVGESNDACDASHKIAFTAKNGERVRLAAGKTELVELEGLTREIKWKCDDSSERVANPNEFNWVQVERAGNGAIHWVFYRSPSMLHPGNRKAGPAENDASFGDFIHNIPGDVTVALAGTKKVFPNPGVLKKQIDTTWDGLRDTIKAKVEEKATDPKVRLNSVTPASSATSDLRIAKTATGVTLKYVVHGNKATGTYIQKDPGVDVNFVATFDVEVALPFAGSQRLSKLKVADARAFAHHVEIAGDVPGDALMVGFAKSRVRAVETRLDAVSSDITKEVNDSLAGILALLKAVIPANFTLASIGIDKAGTLLVCAKSSASQSCTFPASSARPDSRAVLGHSADQCSAGKIWLWDAERGRFVSVAKGAKDVVVELGNRRFEWFCGGDAQADENNDEWASGDPGTFAVRASRDASSREIKWEFLSWK